MPMTSGNVTVIDGTTNNTLPVAAGTQSLRGRGEPEHEPDLRRELWQSNNVTVIDGNAPWSADFVVFGEGQGMARRSQPGNRGRSH